MAVKKYRAKKIISKLLFGILVLVIVIPILFPLYFVLISSFKNMAQVYIMPPKLFGFKPILDNYIYIFKTQHYGTYMMNSTIVAVASTALSLLLGVPAAYAIARYKMGKANTAILTARLLPNISILLPYYFIFSKLRMIDTYGVLILSHMVLSLPLIVWIMVGFFSDLPLELEEAAIVDGCTRQKCFKDVLLPISAPFHSWAPGITSSLPLYSAVKRQGHFLSHCSISCPARIFAGDVCWLPPLWLLFQPSF